MRNYIENKKHKLTYNITSPLIKLLYSNIKLEYEIYNIGRKILIKLLYSNIKHSPFYI